MQNLLLHAGISYSTCILLYALWCQIGVGSEGFQNKGFLLFLKH